MHCLLFQAIKYDTDCHFDNANATSTEPLFARGNELLGFNSLVQSDLSGPSIAALADEVVSTSSCSALKQINSILNAWRVTWDLRLYREIGYNDSGFLDNPMPFWFLAKLYIVLHHYEHFISDDSEFAVSRVKFLDERTKLQVQLKIVRWLSKFGFQSCQLEVLVKNNFLYPQTLLTKLRSVHQDLFLHCINLLPQHGTSSCEDVSRSLRGLNASLSAQFVG